MVSGTMFGALACGSVGTKSGTGGATGSGGTSSDGGGATGTGGASATGGTSGSGGAKTDASSNAGDAPADTAAPDAGDTRATDSGSPDAGPMCAAPPAGVVSYWPADGDYNDPAGGITGTSAGGVTFTAGVVGQAFTFDGTASSYVQMPDNAILRLTGPFTLDAWVNPGATGGRILDKITAGGANGYLLDIINNQARVFAGADSLSSGTTIPLGAYTHVTGVYGGTTLTVYLNGVLAATKITTATVPSNMLPFRIGADSTGANRLTGAVDEARVFGRALSALEVQAIHQPGSRAHCGCVDAPLGLVSWWTGESGFTDAHGTNNGADGGGVTFAPAAVGNGFSLNGQPNAFVLVPNAASLQPGAALTIEAWIDPNNGIANRIVDKITAGGNDGYYMDLTLSQLRFGVGNDSIGSGAGNLVPSAKFTHVAGVFDGSALSVYINGARVANKTTLVTTVPTNSLPMHIGADSTGGTRFSGILDEPRIYNRALSANEIQAIYRDGATTRCQ